MTSTSLAAPSTAQAATLAPSIIVSQSLPAVATSPTAQFLQVARSTLSIARVATYESAAVSAGQPDDRVMELYAWNAEVSGAFLTPLHICEVVIRNAVSEALTQQYGAAWPWSTGFLRSLPSSGGGYDAQMDLRRTSAKHQTQGGVIAELKNVFWEKLFTKRNDQRLWNPYLFQLFPNLDSTQPVRIHRTRIASDLEALRRLRNRIAHHEPIFTRNLQSDFQKLQHLIELRCAHTALWMTQSQRVTTVLPARPF